MTWLSFIAGLAFVASTMSSARAAEFQIDKATIVGGRLVISGRISVPNQLVVLVDTGDPCARDHVLESVFSLVAPEDLRWVFLSHDDADHYGNVMAVLEEARHMPAASSSWS